MVAHDVLTGVIYACRRRVRRECAELVCTKIRSPRIEPSAECLEHSHRARVGAHCPGTPEISSPFALARLPVCAVRRFDQLELGLCAGTRSFRRGFLSTFDALLQ